MMAHPFPSPLLGTGLSLLLCPDPSPPGTKRTLQFTQRFLRLAFGLGLLITGPSSGLLCSGFCLSAKADSQIPKKCMAPDSGESTQRGLASPHSCDRFSHSAHNCCCSGTWCWSPRASPARMGLCGPEKDSEGDVRHC